MESQSLYRIQMSQNQIIEAEVVSLSETPKSQSELVKSEVIDDKLAWLDDSEKYALSYFKDSFQKGGPSTYAIAPSTQAELFTLFLNGRSLKEIRKLNHPRFSLGQICHAAIEGDWENQRKDYLAGLMGKARERLQQIGCEAIMFMGDSLAAAHKMHGDALAKYMQSGNPADQGAFGITSIRQYKEVLELLLKASGADKTSNTNLNVRGSIEHVAGESIANSVATKGKSLKELAAMKKANEKQ
jgi:hypothetical protein